MTVPAGAVLFDAQGAQNRTHFDRGIPRYITEQLRALRTHHPATLSTVGINPALPLTDNLTWLVGDGVLEWLSPRRRAPEPLPRVFHVTSPFELDRSLDELWPVWARRPAVRTVVTVYDLIPLVFADHYLRDPQLRARYLARVELLRSADHVLAISENTKRDVVDLAGVPAERISVVDAGVSPNLAAQRLTVESALALAHERFPALRPGYLLYVSGIEFRKNNERLIEAYGKLPAELRRSHQLVILCRMLDEERAALRRHARAHGIADDDLLLTGYVTDGELAAFYRAARLFVFASFYEGSGLPILEAMATGLPVVASGTSTTPEILGDDEGTFDPYDPADIARCLARTISDDALLDRLRERSSRRVERYTWRHVADRTVEGYAAACEERRRRPRRSRPRIALYTPWPPERSGIAGYNARLAPELAEHVDVDLVVAGDEDYVQPEHADVRLVAAANAGWLERLRAYDAVVYCMGNSSFHGYVYEALRARPGLVVAHDVRLSGFYGWYSGRERPDDPGGRFVERVLAMYGDRLGPGAFADGPPDHRTLARLGLFMTHELQEYASHILVHSRHAADVLRLDRALHGPEAPPIDVVPLACPPVCADGVDRSGDPLIVSFGVVSEVKNLRTLIEAFSLVVARHPRARLVLAGGADEPELERWRRLARQLGVGDRVDVPGHVDAERYQELLRTATVAVQMRLTTNGEASAAVVETLAHGLPTVVTRLGWFAELPGDAVVAVDREVSSPTLASELVRLIDDAGLRATLADGGCAYAAERSAAAVARRYLEAMGLGGDDG